MTQKPCVLHSSLCAFSKKPPPMDVVSLPQRSTAMSDDGAAEVDGEAAGPKLEAEAGAEAPVAQGITGPLER